MLSQLKYHQRSTTGPPSLTRGLRDPNLTSCFGLRHQINVCRRHVMLSCCKIRKISCCQFFNQYAFHVRYQNVSSTSAPIRRKKHTVGDMVSCHRCWCCLTLPSKEVEISVQVSLASIRIQRNNLIKIYLESWTFYSNYSILSSVLCFLKECYSYILPRICDYQTSN